MSSPKPRPSFPASLNNTLASNRPSPRGAVVPTAAAPVRVQPVAGAVQKASYVPTKAALPQGLGMDSGAVLSLLADEVYSIERLRGLHDKARDNLRALRVPNLHLLFGDGMEGFAKGAPYAAIISAAGGEAVPQAWVDQLAVGGRLVAPLVVASNGGHGQSQALLVLDKTTQGIRQSILEAVHFVPLKSGVA